MKNLLALIFVLNSIILCAQMAYEVKTDLLLPVYKSGLLSFEMSNPRHLSMEVEVRALSSDVAYAKIDPLCVGCTVLVFNEQTTAFNAQVHVKYYLQPAERKFRIFSSLYLRSDYLISRLNKDYNAAHIRLYEARLDPTNIESQSLRNAIGISCGLKYYIHEHWCIEAAMGMDKNILPAIKDQHMTIGGLPAIKLGYRF